MRVLVACEFSQVVVEAFTQRGHYAMSCDLLPPEKNYPHYQGDILDILVNHWDEFDLLIAHPPCTYLTLAGNRWMKPEYRNRYPNREQQRKDAIDFFMLLIEAPIPRIAVENPIGIMSRIYRKPDQIIQPYQFGHDVRKPTCLWLRNLPPLFPTNIVAPKLHTDKNGHTDSYFHYESFNLPAKERAKFRSRTFEGIANAMASQWGCTEVQG